ncbi:MAG: hypothetical protein E2O61_14310 [Gammaproteobacteria bacterium]|nr:MAG: hypothetical protein E2O61_14310 [Gammaproteobacteria bacterium]
MNELLRLPKAAQHQPSGRGVLLAAALEVCKANCKAIRLRIALDSLAKLVHEQFRLSWLSSSWAGLCW